MMAKRGRKPKPPELKILTGTSRRPANPVAATHGAPGIPDKPAMVAGDPIASAEWDVVVADLDGRGILSKSDRGILAAYCNAYSRLHNAWKLCDVYETATRDGAAVKGNPAVAMASQASKDLARAAAELGLTPTARVRVGPAAAAADSFDQFLQEGG